MCRFTLSTIYGLFFSGLIAIPSMASAFDKISSPFIQEAIAISESTISAGELALEKSSAQEVKAYAQKMVNDYSSIQQDLEELKNKEDIKDGTHSAVATSSKPKSRIIMEDEKDGFDVIYARNQISSHQKMIALFQEASESADDDAKNLAAATLPYLRRHLLMAEQLLAATAETNTDIHQDRTNQPASDKINNRVPTTDRDAE